MSRYRARDLTTVAGLLSLSRIPLGLVFARVANRPKAALGVLATAALTDVLDGYFARKLRCTSATGAAIDPVADKLFVAAVATTLIARRELPAAGALALSMRDLGELAMLIHAATSRKARAARAQHPRANAPGKAATVLQFVSIAATILRDPKRDALLALTGLVGLASAASYLQRELRVVRAAARALPARAEPPVRGLRHRSPAPVGSLELETERA